MPPAAGRSADIVMRGTFQTGIAGAEPSDFRQTVCSFPGCRDHEKIPPELPMQLYFGSSPAPRRPVLIQPGLRFHLYDYDHDHHDRDRYLMLLHRWTPFRFPYSYTDQNPASASPGRGQYALT